MAGIGGSSTLRLADPDAYRLYRQSVRHAYGVDLEEMNYFGIGQPGWESRIKAFRKWLLASGKYGDVTVALEPLGAERFGVFRDGLSMRMLREAFREASRAGVTVWVRFGSEANLKGSQYSVYGSRKRGLDFFRKARWFKRYMPGNVRMVFSPLINTVVLGEPGQVATVRWMFSGEESGAGDSWPWDCIGGTLYRTDLDVGSAYSAYYDMMSSMNGSLPFQLCELGGPYRRRAELVAFLRDAANGRWPRVRKINLFARDINKRADPGGQFGFMDPDKRARAAREAVRLGRPVYTESYLKSVLAGGEPW